MTASTTMQSSGHAKPRTLGELKRIPDFDPRGASRSVKDELRRNLFRAIEKGETLFPGVHGYEDTVIPQIVNALLSRHNFILLGLRGQAKSRILRGLINLLDPEMPVLAGCEINDDPLKPICLAPIAASSPSMSCPTSPAKSKSASSTSCRKATFKLRAIPCVFPLTCSSSSPPTPRITPRAEKSSPRSKTASAQRFARTIPRRSKRA